MAHSGTRNSQLGKTAKDINRKDYVKQNLWRPVTI